MLSNRLHYSRAVDFKFRIGERFDEVTPDKRDVRWDELSHYVSECDSVTGDSVNV